MISDLFILLEAMDDLRTYKDDQIGFGINTIILTEGCSNHRKAAQAGDARFKMRFGVLDHPTDSDKVFIGNVHTCI